MSKRLMKTGVSRAVIVMTTCAGALALQAQPFWPQFRGPNCQGISDGAKPPIEFGSTTNLVWCVAVAPGHSSPCIWGQKIFLTACKDGRLETQAFDRTTGKQLWRHVAPIEKIEKVQPFNSPASPTPVADADHVFAYFGSFGVLCYDHDGRELWRKPLPSPKNQYGTASSPVLCGDRLVLVLDSDDGKSSLLALRAQDGGVIWQTDRSQFTANWSTPIAWEHDNRQDLVLLGHKRLTAYDPDSGKPRWWVDGFSPETVGVPVIGSGFLFASAANRTGGQMEKYQGVRWEQLLQLDRNGDKRIQRSEIPEDYLWIMRPDYPTNNPGYAAGSLLSRFDRIDADKDGALSEAEWEAYATQWGLRFCPGLKAVRPGNNGDLTESHVAWQLHRGIPEIPSPLFYRDRLYLVRDGGVLQCVRPEAGKTVYEERLGAPGAYCASPVAANGLIYFSSNKGTIIVIDGDSDALRVLGRNALGEKIWATPALVQDALYVRTEQHLFSFSAASRLSGHSQGDDKR